MIPVELLELVPGCSPSQPPLRVQPLPGGQGRNEVLRLDTPEGRYVWRRRLLPLDRPGALALTELRAHRHAAAAGLAPPVLAAAADASWILMPYIDAAPWSADDLVRGDGLARLAGRLAQLHQIRVPADLPMADAPAMARSYLDILQRRDTKAAVQMRPLVHEVEQLTVRLAGPGLRRALVHGDLAASNMLGPAPLLVDWEYAQVADPGWDWACLLTYYPQLQAVLPRLLALAGLERPEERARLELQRQRFALLDRLWKRAYSSVPGAGAG